MQHSIIGKIAQQSIYTKLGTPLISKSQKITPALAAVAKKWNVLDQLCNAVKDTQSMGGRSQEESASALVSSTSESGINTLQQVGCQQEGLIKAALGHPVKHRVTDRQGNVVLDVGELITYCAVEQAKRANVLSFLLNSVYIKR